MSIAVCAAVFLRQTATNYMGAMALAAGLYVVSVFCNLLAEALEYCDDK